MRVNLLLQCFCGHTHHCFPHAKRVMAESLFHAGSCSSPSRRGPPVGDDRRRSLGCGHRSSSHMDFASDVFGDVARRFCCSKCRLGYSIGRACNFVVNRGTRSIGCARSTSSGLAVRIDHRIVCVLSRTRTWNRSRRRQLRFVCNRLPSFHCDTSCDRNWTRTFSSRVDQASCPARNGWHYGVDRTGFDGDLK